MPFEHRNEQGQRHRLDGPAVEGANGTKQWFQNGQLHRLDGPAVEYANGTKVWYQNDQRHRLEGPAVVIRSASGKFQSWQWLNKGEEWPNCAIVAFCLGLGLCVWEEDGEVKGQRGWRQKVLKLTNS